MAAAPTEFFQSLSARDLHLGPSSEVAIVGDPALEPTRALVEEVVRTRWRPNVVLAVARLDDVGSAHTIPLLADRPAIDGLPTAYVCQRFVCQLPVTTATDLRKMLT